MSDHWIQTYTGVRFDLVTPRPEDVRVEDVAHALANLNRFTGHASRPWSVGQHSLVVAALVPYGYRNEGLLHDAAEAYVGDVARPLKLHPALCGYGPIERAVMVAIESRFRLAHSPAVRAATQEADRLALAVEAHELLGPLLPGWEWLPERTPAALAAFSAVDALSPVEIKSRLLTELLVIARSQ